MKLSPFSHQLFAVKVRATCYIWLHKHMRNVLLVTTFLSLVSCSTAPKPAASPGNPPAAAMKVRSNPTKSMIAMNDPAIDDYIVKDISDSLEGNSWRWGYERPEVRLQLKQTGGQKLEAHFSVADATFKTTGPVTVNFFVNNKNVGTMKITKPGDQVFSKEVPADMLSTTDMTDVAIEAKPFWTSAGDGRHLTVILTQVGFVS